MKLRIDRLEIDKLFDRFDYKIDLRKSENGIWILTAPNGYGKSTILKIIKSFAYGDYFYFIREKFKSIRFYFSDGSTAEVIHLDDDYEKAQVTIRRGNQQTKIKDPFGSSDSDEQAFLVDRALPFLTRVSPKSWRHDRTGEALDRIEILSRYGDHPILRRKFKREEWLESLRSSLSVFSIPTNRLKSEDEHDLGQNPSSGSLMVAAIAREIKERIQSAIRKQFEIGRVKETSFPTRLIESLRAGVTPARDSVTASIQAVQEYEERFARLGLLPHTGTTKQLNYHAESSETAGMLVLKTYLDDIREKFSLLDSLAKQLDVFCTSINSLVAFKLIETSADAGIVMRVIDGKREQLALSVLSSGEQHLIVLIGKLVFSTDRESLVLIDEPEISFHPEWQEKFLSILEEIRKLNGFSALIATHSPILIGDRWENVVELAEQHRAAGDQFTLREIR
jgi:predicted ATP-binding protein involved in virulence